MIHRRKRMIVVLGVFAFATALFAFAYFFRRYPDPVYAGLPFSEHLYRMYHRRFSPLRRPGRPLTVQELEEFRRHQLQRQASYNALTNVGTEALPLLKDWLTAQHPPWKSNLSARLNTYFPRLTANRRTIALTFLEQFSVEGSGELFPLIANAATNENAIDQRLAAGALTRIAFAGKNIDVDTALRALLPISYGTKDRGFAMSAGDFYVSNVKHDVDRAIEALDPQRIYHPLIVLELGPQPNRVGAARELAEFPRLPHRAVPLLISNLSSTNRSVQEHCAITLGCYREQAKPALPALSNLLSHPRERVRVAASNAISSINSTDALTSR